MASSSDFNSNNGIQLPLLIVVSIFVGLVVSTFGLPIFLGFSWWPLPFTAFTPHGRTPSYNPAYDTLSFPQVDWPWRVLEANQLQQGHFPLWNAYSSLGLPFAAQYQNQAFFPLEWIEMFGNPTVWNFLLIIKLVLAALGSYLALKKLITEDIAALAGSISYLFSAYLLWWYPVAAFFNGAILVPWLFLGIWQLRDETKPVLPTVGLTSLVLSLILLSGQPQMSFLSIGAGGLYLTVVTFLSVKSKRALLALVGFGISICLGLGIAGIQIRLFLEAIREGYTIHPPGSYTGASVAILNFTILIWPFLLGQLMSPWNASLFPSQVNWEAFPFVTGGFGIFFLCFTLSRMLIDRHFLKAHKKSEIWAIFFVFLLIFVVIISGTLGIKHLWSLPVINRINFPRYITPILSFMTASLIAVGFTFIKEITKKQILMVDFIIVIISFVGLKLIYPHFVNVLETPNRTYAITSLWLGLIPFLISLFSINVVLIAFMRRRLSLQRTQFALILCMLAELTFFVRYGLSLENEMYRLMVLIVYSAASILVLARLDKLLIIALPMLSLVTLLILGFASNSLAKSWNPYSSPPPYIQFLQDKLGQGSKEGRTLTAREIAIPNISTGFGVADLASLNPVQLQTTAQYIFEALSEETPHYIVPNAWYGLERVDRINSTNRKNLAPGQGWPTWLDYFARRKYYNFVGVKYLVDAPTGWLSQNSKPDVKLVYEDNMVRIYEDMKAFPRAFALTNIQTVSDLATAQKAILAPEFDIRSQAIVEQENLSLLPALITLTDNQIFPIEIAEYSDNEVVLNSTIERDSLVVLTDGFYPGWKAYVDGEVKDIYRVNSIVRGVFVEAGMHQIEFRYKPEYLNTWLLISASSFTISILLLFRFYRAWDSGFQLIPNSGYLSMRYNKRIKKYFSRSPSTTKNALKKQKRQFDSLISASIIIILLLVLFARIYFDIRQSKITAPIKLVAVRSMPTTIDLSWKATQGGKTFYDIEMKRGDGEFTKIGVTGVNHEMYTIENIASYAIYYFRIRACDGKKCSPYSEEIEVEPIKKYTQILPPKLLSHERLTPSTIKLSWQNQQEETDVYIEMKGNDGEYMKLGSAPTNTTTYTIGDVAPDAVYLFRVRACRGGNCSPYTKEVSVPPANTSQP